MNSLAAPVDLSLKHILFATDFSSCSEAALLYASSLARWYASTLFTVTVVPEEITDYVQPPDPFYLRHSAENKMADLGGSTLLRGIKHRELVKEGFVSEVIADLIERLEVDLVVVGTRGRSGIKKLVLGSVAEGIIESASCPVLTVGPLVSFKSGSDLKLRRVLCATDVLHASTRALNYAVWLAEHEHARLTLLHVLKTSTDVSLENPESQKEIALTRLKQLLSPGMTTLLQAEFMVEIGLLEEHILKVAEHQNADLILMSWRRPAFTRTSTHLPWITPHQIVCHAPCPVLTVRE